MGKTETETRARTKRRTRTFRRTTMFRKLTLALVAAASLSAMALAPTSASAGGVLWPHHHHHHHHWGHGHGFGVGFVGGGGYDGCYADPPRADAVRLPLADGERLLLIRPQTFRSEAPVARAAGVFRMRYARPQAPPPAPCKRQESAPTGCRSAPAGPIFESPPPGRVKWAQNRQNGGNRVRMGAFLPKRPFRLRYPACPNPRILMLRACRYVRGPAARLLF